MSSYEKPKGGRHLEITRKYKASFTDKGKICNKCNEDLELDHYKAKSSICKQCQHVAYKKKYKKQTYKLW